MKFQDKTKRFFRMYINSKEWQERESAIISLGVKCEVCGDDASNLYHVIIRYPVNCEDMMDMIPLCGKHMQMVKTITKKGLVPAPTFCKKTKDRNNRRKNIIKRMQSIEKENS